MFFSFGNFYEENTKYIAFKKHLEKAAQSLGVETPDVKFNETQDETIKYDFNKYTNLYIDFYYNDLNKSKEEELIDIYRILYINMSNKEKCSSDYLGLFEQDEFYHYQLLIEQLKAELVAYHLSGIPYSKSPLMKDVYMNNLVRTLLLDEYYENASNLNELSYLILQDKLNDNKLPSFDLVYSYKVSMNYFDRKDRVVDLSKDINCLKIPIMEEIIKQYKI